VKATRNPDGTLTVPARAEHEDGTTGDGMTTLKPGDPGYDMWAEWIRDGESSDTGPSDTGPSGEALKSLREYWGQQ
jgi:hypothetical protein